MSYHVKPLLDKFRLALELIQRKVYGYGANGAKGVQEKVDTVHLKPYSIDRSSPKMELRALADKTQLKKHVGAIHTRGKLSLLQRKVANVLLLNAYEDLLKQEMHSIRIKDLAEVIGFDSKNVEVLKEALRGLTDIKIEWNILDHEGEEEEWGRTSMLAGVTIVSRRGICRYSYYADLREKLFNPAVYARINLSVQREFRSAYALALYENCVRFRNIGSTGWIELETWRDLLGVREGTYPAFKELRRRVLNPAIKEVNEHSDILVTLEAPQRKKRRIVALKFNIENNHQLSLGLENQPGTARYEVINEDGEKSPLEKRLAEFGLETTAEEIIKKYDEARITGNLEIIESKISRGERIESIPAMARDAIEKDYRLKKTPIEVDLEGQRIEAKQQQEANRVAREAAARKEQEEEAARDREIDTKIKKLPEDVRMRLDEMAARKYGQLMGGEAFEKYRDAKQKGEVPKMNEAVMQSFRRHVFESPEFVKPVQES